jgi:hypothetical protein
MWRLAVIAMLQPAYDPAELNRWLLQFNEDDAPVRNERENRDEALAFDYVVNFASRVPAEAFAAAARRDRTFAHLLGPEAARHRGEVVRVEGRLKRVRDISPTPGLQADGVAHLYEGWIFSELYRDYSYCVVFTERPPGIDVAESLDRRVAFEGFFFKVYRFQAGDGARRAPLLIGRTLRPLPATAGPSLAPAVAAAPVVIGGVAVALTAGVALAWWLRRGDTAARARIRAARCGGGPFPGE